MAATFAGCDGILVPGGFGYRGVEGKIAALRKTMEGDDAAAIKAATEELAKTSHKLAEQLYQQQAPNGGAQQPGAGANPGAGAAQGNNNDDVVDADFTEVKK